MNLDDDESDYNQLNGTQGDASSPLKMSGTVDGNTRSPSDLSHEARIDAMLEQDNASD